MTTITLFPLKCYPFCFATRSYFYIFSFLYLLTLYQCISNFQFNNVLYYHLLQAAFRTLAGKGYQTLQSLLLDFCQWHSSESLLDALLDMLVDGKFNVKMSPMIKVMYQYIGLAFKNCLIHLHCFIFYSRKLKKVVFGGPDAISYLVL